MWERLTIGARTATGFAILPEGTLDPVTIQEPPSEPLEKPSPVVQKNPCAPSKLTIVLGWVFQVRQVLWRGVASHARRIMMRAAWGSSPNWVDLRHMPWLSADWAPWRAWPTAAASMLTAAAAMAPDCWSRFPRL